MPNTKLPTPAIQFASLSTRFTLAGIAATAALAMVPVAANAQSSFTPPASLNPGDHYRLVFITSTAIDATSTDIATYNSFVTTAAANNATLPTTTWRAIASTATTNAIDNIACTPSCSSDPIFLVEGSQVATSSDNFWAGALMHTITLTELGSSTVPTLNGKHYAWTGTLSDGTAYSGATLGAPTSRVGNINSTGGNFLSDFTDATTYTGPLYAISGDLIVPAVPEPAALSLLASGGVLTLLAARLRRQRRASV